MNVILADHTLKSYMGHSFEYARSLGDHVRSLGHEVTTLAARQVSAEVIDDIGAIPCFRRDLAFEYKLPVVFSALPKDVHGWLRDEWTFWRHARVVHRDLWAVQDRLSLDNDALVLFPTMAYNDVVPVVKWAEHLPEERCPWMALVFHFTTTAEYSVAYPCGHYYGRAFAAVERSPRRHRFRLFTDSELLAEEYRALTNLPIQVLPIPHTQPGTSSRVAAKNSRTVGPVRLTYLGDARTNKGFHHLAHLVQRLEPEFNLGLIEAEFQANVRNPDEWKVLLALRRLRDRTGVRLHENELTTAQYYELLDRAGIVLLPYTLENYHAQTSGIFAEALAWGKPVVVPRGTWMAGELKRHGAGVTFLPGDLQSLYESVLQAVEEYPRLRSAASEKAAHWRQVHCPASYWRTICASLSEGTGA